MFLRLVRYKINLHYVPGTKVYIADMLSRAHPPCLIPAEDNQIEKMELRIHSLVSSPPISNEKMNLMKQATAADDALQVVKTLNIKGRPAYKRDTPICTR